MLYYVYYYPQTKLREGNVFTPGCDSVHRGGGVHGESGVHDKEGMHVKGGMCGKGGGCMTKRGDVWQGYARCGGGGVNGKGACVERQPLKRAVCILLECILVILWFPTVSNKLKFL